ncbi:hypothetical protein ABT294_18070 [Nonomuraea sp. NPDC000554]|uniref:hypothetical protein n=1 Tax=Nonomuraea sp. NPDC000554 TaxID=3154259 RepID=UPI00331F9C71
MAPPARRHPRPATVTANPPRRRRPAPAVLTAGVVCCLVVAVLAGCGTVGGAGGTEPTPATGPPASPNSGKSPGQAELDRSATRIDEYLRTNFPDHYAGIVVDQPRSTIIVYRRRSAELDAALPALAGGHVRVEPRDAPHSAMDLRKLADRVQADIEYWSTQGVTITSVAVRPDGTAVEVGTRELARARTNLPQRYGAAPLDIIESNPTLLTPG